MKTINNWVSDKTHGKIDEIIEAIDPAMMMILINAIYFNCVWEVEFDPKDTNEAPFYNEDGQVYGQVDMMRPEEHLSMWLSQKISVQLNFPIRMRNSACSCSFLQKHPQWMNWWLNWMERPGTSGLKNFLKSRTLPFTCPNSNLNIERSMADDLKEMGLEVAFTDEADFSGISPIDLLISDVIHKTYIDVNEEGTEAAAVTAIVFETTSIGPPSFIRLDRPFLFAITENSRNQFFS